MEIDKVEFHITFREKPSDFFSKGVNIKAMSLDGALLKFEEEGYDPKSIITIINRTNLNK
jgi:hypothetical protein